MKNIVAFTIATLVGLLVSMSIISSTTKDSNVLIVRPALPKSTIIITVNGYSGNNAPQEVIKYIKQGYQINNIITSGQYSYQNVVLVKY